MTPSFLYKMNERKRLTRRVGVSTVLPDASTKSSVRDFASRHEIPHPAEIAAYPSVNDVEWDSLPPSFVIKPDDLYRSEGVYVVSNGISVFDKQTFDAAAACDDISQRIGRSSRSSGVIIEEFLGQGPTLLDDWKCYTHFGEVSLIAQVSRKGSRDPQDWRVKWWSESFESVGSVGSFFPRDETLIPPQNGEPLVELARQISRLLITPFVRVDLYNIGTGPVLGELTFVPGSGQVFVPEWDERLGRAWEDAEARIVEAYGPPYAAQEGRIH